jgi:hypothetical protein
LLESHTRVLDSIEEAHKVDPIRASSIVDLADALKSNRLQEFALKYTLQNKAPDPEPHRGYAKRNRWDS